jgi:hypothetical protein
MKGKPAAACLLPFLSVFICVHLWFYYCFPLSLFSSLHTSGGFNRQFVDVSRVPLALPVPRQGKHWQSQWHHAILSPAASRYTTRESNGSPFLGG